MGGRFQSLVPGAGLGDLQDSLLEGAGSGQGLAPSQKSATALWPERAVAVGQRRAHLREFLCGDRRYYTAILSTGELISSESQEFVALAALVHMGGKLAMIPGFNLNPKVRAFLYHAMMTIVVSSLALVFGFWFWFFVLAR
jgi:hypothetical protein